MKSDSASRLRSNIRLAIIITILGLMLNGLSAFPLERELLFALHFSNWLPAAMTDWLQEVLQGVRTTSKDYPLMLYGYYWLGFAHFLIALAFFGPLADPVKNQWVIKWGILTSGLTVPFAFIVEPLLGIPFFWTVIDAVIGAGAFIILLICNSLINRLQTVIEHA